jgi:hypothetical protein
MWALWTKGVSVVEKIVVCLDNFENKGEREQQQRNNRGVKLKSGIANCRQTNPDLT